jgi:hypothetical protein
MREARNSRTADGTRKELAGGWNKYVEIRMDPPLLLNALSAAGVWIRLSFTQSGISTDSKAVSVRHRTPKRFP